MMKLLLIFFIPCFASLAYGQSSLDGFYIGLEEMCYVDENGKKECYSDPADPKRKWYRLSKMKIKGDSVFVDQSPIAIYKKDTIFSASDGGFYYYRGTIKQSDSLLSISLVEFYCDYCGVEVITLPDGTREIKKRTKKWTARLAAEDLVVNGYLFRRMKEQRILRSERSRVKN